MNRGLAKQTNCLIRVCHFLHRVPPEYSGAAIQAIRLIQSMDCHSVSNSIVALTEQKGEHIQVVEKQTVIQIKRTVFGKLFQTLELLSAIAKTRCDILHIHGFHLPTLLCGILLRKRIVLKTTLNGVDDLTSLNIRYSRIMPKILEHIDAVISLTQALYKANSLAGGKNWLIPNGVDLNRFKSKSRNTTSIKKVQSNNNDRLCFLYAGGDSERKGFNELPGLLDFLNKYVKREFQLLVVGNFTNSKSKQDLLQGVAKKSNLIIIDELVDIPEIFENVDFFVSLSACEGLPNTVLEAAACDVFILAREIDGVYDNILDESNSIKFRTLNSVIGDKLSGIINNYKYINLKNDNFRNAFNIENISKRYLDLYCDLSGNFND